MSKAIELAEQCGSTHKQSLGVYQFFPAELEAYFRRAQAMALREAAREFRIGDPAPKHWAVTSLERMADELEAGK